MAAVAHDNGPPVSRARFRAPPPWAWALTAAAVVGFGALGAWQWRKGVAKETLLERLADRSSPVEALSGASAPGAALRRAQAAGVYRPEQLLQDGQGHGGQPGYHVWTPMQLRDSALVLVNRGWVPRVAAARELPMPAGEVVVTGTWRALPEPGLRLAGANNCPEQKRFPAVVLYPTAAELECLMGRSVLEGLLLMDPDLDGGFTREWQDTGVPPQRHYGYAFQWLALAVAAVVMFWAVNRERRA